MIPLSKFADMLQVYQEQLNSDMSELQMAARLIGDRPFCFTMDENGMFHAQASGTLDECIRALKSHLTKLENIKSYKETGR